jgi:hypothetical protein
VVINEQIRPSSGSQNMEVNGLRIVISQNNSVGLPVGAEVVIAQAVTRAK